MNEGRKMNEERKMNRGMKNEKAPTNHVDPCDVGKKEVKVKEMFVRHYSWNRCDLGRWWWWW